MIVGTVASADQSAFAKHHKHKHHKHSSDSNRGDSNRGDSTRQSIDQSNVSHQKQLCQASGGIAIGTGSGGLVGAGIGAGGTGGQNFCVNSNPQTNANTGNNGNLN